MLAALGTRASGGCRQRGRNRVSSTIDHRTPAPCSTALCSSRPTPGLFPRRGGRIRGVRKGTLNEHDETRPGCSGPRIWLAMPTSSVMAHAALGRRGDRPGLPSTSAVDVVPAQHEQNGGHDARQNDEGDLSSGRSDYEHKPLRLLTSEPYPFVTNHPLEAVTPRVPKPNAQRAFSDSSSPVLANRATRLVRTARPVSLAAEEVSKPGLAAAVVGKTEASRAPQEPLGTAPISCKRV